MKAIISGQKLKKQIPFVSIIMLAGMLYCFTFDSKLDLSGDNVKYYLLGQALANGKGYVSIWEPDTPQHTHFPPGYPAIIALVIMHGFKKVVAIKVVNFVFLIFTSFILYAMTKRLASSLVAMIVAILFCTNATLLHYSSIMMSEMSYIFFSLLTLWLMLEGAEKGQWSGRVCLWSLALVSAIVAYFIRGMGVALFLTIIIYLFFRRQWIWGILTAVGWGVLSQFTLQSQHGYLHAIRYKNIYQLEQGVNGLADYASRILLNSVRYCFIELPRIVLPCLHILHPGWLGMIIGIVLLALIGVSFWRLKRAGTLFLIYGVVNAGILLLWPEQWYGERFFLPLYGVVMFLVVYGTWCLARRIPNGAYVLIALFIVYLELQSPTYWKFHRLAKSKYPLNWQCYFSMARWAGQNTPEKSVFVTRKESFFYLFSGRRACRYPFTPDDQQLVQYLEQKGADYVLVENLGFSSTDRYLIPAINKNIDRFTSVCFVNLSRIHLYKFHPPNAIARR